MQLLKEWILKISLWTLLTYGFLTMTTLYTLFPSSWNDFIHIQWYIDNTLLVWVMWAILIILLYRGFPNVSQLSRLLTFRKN
jgi:hypothetical protein